jgi:hypothetical protein
VKGVTNVITVKPKVEPSELKRKIMEAFKPPARLHIPIVPAGAGNGALEGTIDYPKATPCNL